MLDVLNLDMLANTIGKNVKTDPIDWVPDDIQKIANAFKNTSYSQISRFFVTVQGTAPAWLITGLAHLLMPADIMLSEHNKTIRCNFASYGNGKSNNVSFMTISRFDGWISVNMEIEDWSKPITFNDNSILPNIESNSKIIINAPNLPNWLVASIAMSYNKKAKAIAVYEKNIGSIVVITNTGEHPLGSVIS